MLKNVAITIIGTLVLQTGLMAQIYVKNPGNVGIGTSTPGEKLHVIGKELIESNGGDHINLHSSGNMWVNMSFFRNGNRHGWLGLNPGNDFYISKDQPGNIWITPKQGTVIIESTIDGSIGSGLSLRNPLKAPTPGTALNWTIYNMAGTYGNSLQFWAYDLQGCAGGLCNPRFTIMDDGRVGINTTSPVAGYFLNVAGDILANNYVGLVNGHYADYVFDSTYQLPPLREVESFIKQNHHLPEIPTTADVKKDGLNVIDHQVKLLKKIEELTLYVIDQNKKQEEQNEKLARLEKKMNELMEENKKLKEKSTVVQQ